jgi:small subunit ribosomal protein S4
MGDPRKIRSKYSRPRHPWEGTRIAEETALVREYGLKNKTEIWKLSSKLKTFKDIAKNLIAATGAQAGKERTQLLGRLSKYGLVKPDAPLDDVLGLTLKDILERRLQTLVFRKGLARTMTQARQFIVHSHVAVGAKTVSSPGYLVTTAEEPNLQFVAASALSSIDHPERVPPQAPPPQAQEKPAGEKPQAPGGARPQAHGRARTASAGPKAQSPKPKAAEGGAA